MCCLGIYTLIRNVSRLCLIILLDILYTVIGQALMGRPGAVSFRNDNEHDA